MTFECEQRHTAGVKWGEILPRQMVVLVRMPGSGSICSLAMKVSTWPDSTDSLNCNHQTRSVSHSASERLHLAGSDASHMDKRIALGAR